MLGKCSTTELHPQPPQMLFDSIHEVPRVVKLVQTENGLVVARGWEKGMGS
jgi:hypothetical protein